jgi:hypothetical protein
MPFLSRRGHAPTHSEDALLAVQWADGGSHWKEHGLAESVSVVVLRRHVTQSPTYALIQICERERGLRLKEIRREVWLDQEAFGDSPATRVPKILP